VIPRPSRRIDLKAVVPLLLALAASSATACRPPADAARISAAWTSGPEAGRESQVQFELRDHRDQPIAGARLQVRAFMTHAGMAPIEAIVEDTGGGGYRARVQFTMGGDWLLRVTGEQRDGRAIDAAVAVPGVQQKP
jgi:hypothetical protein